MPNSLVVGSIGTSIFRSMQDRLIATIAVKKAGEAEANEAETKRIAAEADQRVAEAIRTKSSDRQSESLGAPSSEESDVMNLLEEAHALYQSIQRN